MKISVFGTGYVGLVTGVCFAEKGHQVLCVDIDENKVEKLKSGVSPIYEPGLDDLLVKNIEAERLFFSTDLQKAVTESDVLFIAVGTPPQENGAADLSVVMDVAKLIGLHMRNYKLIVNKSTVPVGTAGKVKQQILEGQQTAKVVVPFDVASNPEFLREGCALEDCLKPARVVVGADKQQAFDLLKEIYEPFLTQNSQFITMATASSEMTKYAANAMLATRISFMNEISRLCEKTGAQIQDVQKGIGSDPRIGSQFLVAGIGYGGSCFPKDVQALLYMAKENQVQLGILNSVETANQTQRQHFLNQARQKLGGFQQKQITVWGLAFKPGTDDIRESPALYVIRQLLDEGATVVAHDPIAINHVKNVFPETSQMIYKHDSLEALDGSEALMVITDWQEYKNVDHLQMSLRLKKPYVFDGRNIYQPEHMDKLGFKYSSVGRPSLGSQKTHVVLNNSESPTL